MKEWVNYYNERASRIKDPIEIAEMSITKEQYKLDVQKILSYLSLPKDDILVDLGCCTGNSIEMVKPYVKSIIGVDMSVNALSCAQSRHPDCQFILDDVTTLKSFKDKSYSLFLCFGLLHYLSDEEISQLFATLSRIIKSNGTISFLRVPDIVYYDSYQSYRRNKYNKNKIVDNLKWNWISEEIIYNLALDHGFIYERKKQLVQSKMPMQAFFDFSLKINPITK